MIDIILCCGLIFWLLKINCLFWPVYLKKVSVIFEIFWIDGLWCTRGEKDFLRLLGLKREKNSNSPPLSPAKFSLHLLLLLPIVCYELWGFWVYINMKTTFWGFWLSITMKTTFIVLERIQSIERWILIWTAAVWTMVRLNYCSFELLFIWTTDMTSYPV